MNFKEWFDNFFKTKGNIKPTKELMELKTEEPSEKEIENEILNNLPTINDNDIKPDKNSLSTKSENKKMNINKLDAYAHIDQEDVKAKKQTFSWGFSSSNGYYHTEINSSNDDALEDN